MNDLYRRLAPLSERAWKRIDEEARDVLVTHLAARRLMDFEGPHGWGCSALDLGRVEPVSGDGVPSGFQVARRVVRPLLELRVPFELERAELERVDRGARDVDLEALQAAARTFAAGEDALLFAGSRAASLPGLVTESAHEPVSLPEDGARIPAAVAEALERLRKAGVGGPYALALDPDAHAALERAPGEGGYPVLQHVRRLLDGPVVWAPGLDGGVLLSRRGGDFRLVVGRDVAIGYLDHDAKHVRLYLEESLAAEVAGPEAVVPLARTAAARASR